ncbi:hypothetical protein HMPREF1146_0014 [Prevotella sp. MSX73]|nr:hypothetical protein HMPREF1146_0014 [Prevotella sp. MSX73]
MLLMSVVILMMAGTHTPLFKGKKKAAKADSTAVDSVQRRDSLGNVVVDTTQMDSLERAIYRHNKVVDDSIRLDSLNRKRSGGIEAPIEYTANDSLVYDARTQTAHLFGSSNVKYQNMDLASDKIYMSLDSSLVHATGTRDSSVKDGVKNKPVFTMGQDKYETDTIAFNFKTKKAYIDNVYTEQEDGFLRGERSKRDSTGVIYLEHGRYTTCDEEHPDFYIALSRARVRPGKDVVFGPAYLVVADVPLPLAIPYGFFPFTKRYSSGFIMPSYGDEQARGFYLKDIGYYFALSDKWDLKLLGEIYTRGSWGFSAASNYRKRYRYNGSFLFSYQDTKTGDKGLPDYARQESFKIQWSHRQDSKANPYSSLAASVNFATSSYERNNLNSLYNPQTLTQSTRTSSVSWSTTFSSIGLTLSATANLSQNMRDSTLAVTLPDLNIAVSRFYPFKRKHAVGNERWYEKISMSYTGQIGNSINTKEDKFFKSNLIKEWRNGWNHEIPISGNFTLFNYLNVSPSFRFTDRMQSAKVERSWDTAKQVEVADTTYGFHNIYNWNFSMGMSTKLYGFWTPSRKIFGDKIQAIRHVLTPQVTFSYAPDFGASRYGYWKTYQKTDADGNVSLVEYSPYSTGMFSVPGRGKTGSISFSLGNNLEMKVKSDKDSTGVKRISLIDDLAINMSYNMAAKTRPWSDLGMNIRLKWWKNYTFNMNAVFATYAYELDDQGRPYVGTHTEWGKGRFGRFQGMSQNISYTLTPEKLSKLFGGGGSREDDKRRADNGDDEGVDTDIESNVDEVMERGKHNARKEKSKASTDEDGYMAFSMPWSLTFGYGVTMRESNDINKFNYKKMRYPYKFSQTLNVSGNIRISDGWNISFSSGYDFESHEISMTTASLQRDLHCFNMSCEVVLAPYTSYNFTFRCNAATLTDALKYDKRSGYSNAVQWY